MFPLCLAYSELLATPLQSVGSVKILYYLIWGVVVRRWWLMCRRPEVGRSVILIVYLHQLSSSRTHGVLRYVFLIELN
jgi:hypothetical protein